MKTICCCKTRTASLVLLYMNLFMAFGGLRYTVTKSEFRESLKPHEIIIAFVINGALFIVFIGGITSIRKRRTFGLTAVIVTLVIMCIYILVHLYLINVVDTLRQASDAYYKIAASELNDESDKYYLRKRMEMAYFKEKLIWNVVYGIILIFTIFTVFVVRAHKKELEEASSDEGQVTYETSADQQSPKTQDA